jgi:hypothetical protein
MHQTHLPNRDGYRLLATSGLCHTGKVRVRNADA